MPDSIHRSPLIPMVAGLLAFAGCGSDDEAGAADGEAGSEPPKLIEETKDRFAANEPDAVCTELIAGASERAHAYRQGDERHPAIIAFLDEAELIGSLEIWVVACDNPNLQQLVIAKPRSVAVEAQLDSLINEQAVDKRWGDEYVWVDLTR